MPARVVFSVKIEDLAYAVEAMRHPALEGKPVIVGPDPRRGRGQVIASSDRAKAAGIMRSMEIRSAFKLLPGGVFLRPDKVAVKRLSDQLVSFFRDRADRVQRTAVDEFYLEMSAKADLGSPPDILARALINEVLSRFQLDIAVGCGASKLVARIACGMVKPGCFMVVSPRDVRGFLFPLPVRQLPGVGGKTEGALRRMGIDTVGQLARVARERLVEEFGPFGRRLHQIACGVDESEVVPDEVRRSIVRSRVFEYDLDDVSVISKAVEGLSSEVFKALSDERSFFRTVGVMLRFNDDHVKCRQSTIAAPTDRFEDLSKLTRGLLDEMLESPKPVRSMTIALTGIGQRPSSQKTMPEFTKNVSR